MNIGIIGGGLMGLALARRLGGNGHRITVFEREQQLGGLATYHDFGGFYWDRFYHVILPTDSHLIGFLESIGLGDRLRWRRTLTGFYVDGNFYSMSSALEFLRFPPVSLWGKLRLALTILYCSRIDDWKRLEKIPLEEWLLQWSGKSTYEKIWKPLLLAKLGENYKRASAVFIWSYIKRMYSARDSSARKEELGHISGGYKAVFDRLETLITKEGGRIKKDVAVDSISGDAENGILVEHGNGKRERFDKVIFTGPVNALKRVADEGLLSVEQPVDRIEYLGVVCVVVITSRPVTPYYIVNITDTSLPYTGVIGMSNVVSEEETAGRFITYLPKYVLSTDPILTAPDDEILASFMGGFRRMFPDLDDSDIVGVHVNRARIVQPLQVLGYSDLVPRARTRHKDFYVVNTTQFVNNTLNNNQVIANVEQFLSEYGNEFQ